MQITSSGPDATMTPVSKSNINVDRRQMQHAGDGSSSPRETVARDRVTWSVQGRATTVGLKGGKCEISGWSEKMKMPDGWGRMSGVNRIHRGRFGRGEAQERKRKKPLGNKPKNLADVGIGIKQRS
jgi:hypothetical protein